MQLASTSKRANISVSIKTVDGVLIDQIETENVVQLGTQIVAIKAWEELGFDLMLGDMGMNASQIATAQLMISNRLIEPLSEWALIDWAGRTALPVMLDISITKSTKNRLYQMSDKIYGYRRPIEKALSKHEKKLFGLKRSIILYDVTNTHFEGLCQSNGKAKHGKNKQKRNDCRQVAVGMAFDEYGFPLANEIFEGNMADTKTLEVMLDRLAQIDWEGEAPAGKPVVILGAGFASKKNLELLKARGYSWLINITRGSRSKYAEYFEQEKKLLIERQDEKMEAALELCGDYVLKTDQEMEASELWELYMTC